MDRPALEALLSDVRAGRCSVDEAVSRLGGFPVQDLGFARVDHGRLARCGFPEVVFCQGKTDHEAVSIAKAILARSPRVLLTRAQPATLQALREAFADGHVYERGRLFHVDRDPAPLAGCVALLSAGTGDEPVAEEAYVTATAMGARVERARDVGVAGLHRLLDERALLASANVLIVVAGMEGALPSVVAGLVDRPVIAVPTSVGYGAAFDGLAALLGMMSSCAAGVSVVNIDNGFGAGYCAALINRLASGNGE
jgi:NCAIR mutase (PurE)-related protein